MDMCQRSGIQQQHVPYSRKEMDEAWKSQHKLVVLGIIQDTFQNYLKMSRGITEIFMNYIQNGFCKGRLLSQIVYCVTDNRLYVIVITDCIFTMTQLTEKTSRIQYMTIHSIC